MSVYYHGTTRESARKIIRSGFSPKPPSRAVWFTKSWRYAMSRARGKAGKSKGRAVVLKCNLDVQQLRKQISGRRIASKGGIIAIWGHVPPVVIISQASTKDWRLNKLVI